MTLCSIGNECGRRWPPPQVCYFSDCVHFHFGRACPAYVWLGRFGLRESLAHVGWLTFSFNQTLKAEWHFAKWQGRDSSGRVEKMEHWLSLLNLDFSFEWTWGHSLHSFTVLIWHDLAHWLGNGQGKRVREKSLALGTLVLDVFDHGFGTFPTS
jgi:hypothetical protein